MVDWGGADSQAMSCRGATAVAKAAEVAEVAVSTLRSQSWSRGEGSSDGEGGR